MKEQASYERLLRLAPAKRSLKMLCRRLNFWTPSCEPEAGSQGRAMARTLEEDALSANERLALKMSLLFHLS